jgi:hypothetical protein
VRAVKCILAARLRLIAPKILSSKYPKEDCACNHKHYDYPDHYGHDHGSIGAIGVTR